MNDDHREEEKESERTYELSFLLSSEEAAKEISALLKRNGAEMTHESPVSSIRLAYPIKKLTSAFFGYVHFIAESEKIQLITNELKLKPQIVRMLLLTPPPAPPIRMSRPIREVETKPVLPAELTNEALEQKLEEILK